MQASPAVDAAYFPQARWDSQQHKSIISQRCTPHCLSTINGYIATGLTLSQPAAIQSHFYHQKKKPFSPRCQFSGLCPSKLHAAIPPHLYHQKCSSNNQHTAIQFHSYQQKCAAHDVSFRTLTRSACCDTVRAISTTNTMQPTMPG